MPGPFRRQDADSTLATGDVRQRTAVSCRPARSAAFPSAATDGRFVENLDLQHETRIGAMNRAGRVLSVLSQHLARTYHGKRWM